VYNFNNDRFAPPGAAPTNAVTPGPTTADDAPAASDAAPAADTTPAPQADTQAPAAPSQGFTRFNSCRWQQPAEDGNAAFCTHREVKPYAGTTGFDPDAWCADCQYYKLRRAPKKRQPSDEYSY
jgi:hypothetical protein